MAKDLPGETLVGLAVHLEPDLLLHVHAQLACARLNEGPVEEVSVVGDIDGRLHLSHVVEPAAQGGLLVCLIPHRERPWQHSFRTSRSTLYSKV